MYLQGSEIWHPSCSEEFQRENEAAEKAARNGPASPHLRIQTHQTPESLKPGPYSPNGFNNDSSLEPPESPSAHTWKPPALFAVLFDAGGFQNHLVHIRGNHPHQIILQIMLIINQLVSVQSNLHKQ